MLKLNNVSKTFELGKKQDRNYQYVEALKNINISFRKNEFVSILGPSGCGKTTLLNIIGGLDKYIKGDLIINSKTTKNFSDKDWDTYRNHSVGFVFQNYNLIPHLTVFENVELALTLSGISKKERKEKVIKTLKQVDLGDKIYSKPNQISGGQMQRVAIARALINDPDIILADEPTGALDSKTSLQIMKLLKKISKKKLIIMVTHNPEIAEQYSTRLIKLLDGKLVSDSDPFEYNVETLSDKPIGKKKRMSFFTALSLSFKNLLTKKTRTLLVSFAGSIGIIGIALILALSSGFQTYINNVQEDTLSTYPITISSATIDYSSMLSLMMGNATVESESEEGVINSNDVIVDMFKSLLSGSKTNDLESFKAWLNNTDNDIWDFVSGIQYSYNINLNIYDGISNQILNPNSMFYNGTMYWLDKFIGETYVLPIFRANYIQENSLPADYELTTEEVTAIKSSPTYRSALNSAISNFFSSMEGSGSTDILTEIKALKNTDLGLFTEMLDSNQLLESQYDVVAVEDGVSQTNFFANLGTRDIVLVLDNDGNLSDYVLYALGIKTMPTVEEIADGLLDAENYQIPEDDGYTYEEIVGKEYKVLLDTDYYLDIYDNGNWLDIRAELESGNISQEQYDLLVADLLSDDEVGLKLTIKGIVKAKAGVSATSISGNIGYTKALTELMITKLNTAINTNNDIPTILKVDINSPSSISIYCNNFESKSDIENIINTYNNEYVVNNFTDLATFTAVPAPVLTDIANYYEYDAITENYSKTTDTEIDTNKTYYITDDTAEDFEISYTDYMGILMSSVSTIISAITYVLIAFVSVSLIVSSIMIGIITYISVLERIKEIGILRSIGASKTDIKRVFTAESLIIGFSAGMFGILVTIVLTLPINLIIDSLAGLGNLANLPIVGAIILVVLSMVLTFFAGLIPARIASKKDPVIALRTE